MSTHNTARTASQLTPDHIALRPAHEVMRLDKLGASHSTRLSFMHALLRRVKREGWRFERRVWALNAQGVGHAVYTVHGPQRPYSLVAFAHDLPDDMRSDRVIATAWDATFTLFDGIPTDADLARLGNNVPKQEAGRISDTELTLARANRSVRLWTHVVNALAAGQQPDTAEIEQVGYLMRTTAVYGSGKFGAADRVHTAWRDEMSGPFRAEMLTVWLIRAFTMDCAEHMAKQVGGAKATTLSPQVKRLIGVGNSTGLGMAPFLLNHPALLHQWIACKEQALLRVRCVASATPNEIAVFSAALDQALVNAQQWQTDHPLQVQRVKALRDDLEQLKQHFKAHGVKQQYPWNDLFQWSQNHLSHEGQEQLVGLIMEPYPDLVDELAEQMSIDESKSFTIRGAMALSELRALITSQYQWALAIDFSGANARSQFWYVSEDKLEPRLGQRLTDEGSDLELPLCTAELIQKLWADLASTQAVNASTVADFLLSHPQHRQAIRRVQLCAKYAYAEVQDNLIAADMLPIELLRCKLSFFGATKFDPRSDRWLRISMYQGAPTPDDLCEAYLPQDQRQSSASNAALTYSLSEIEALSKRAARGAGLSWGLAEEASKAVRWLHAHGQQGAAQLEQVLQLNDGLAYALLCPRISPQHWQAQDHMCPLITGAALLDHISPSVAWPIALKAVSQPLLLLPFVARAAQENQLAIELSWQDQHIVVKPDGQVSASSEAQTASSSVTQQANVSLRLVDAQHTGADYERMRSWSKSHKAQPVMASTWDALQRFAHRTLVLNTEASRSGAGSQRSDND